MRLKVEEIKRYIERFFEILILIKDAILDSGGGGDTFNQNIITKNWQPMTTFRKGEYVLHNNQMWECLVDNINQVPVEGTYWKNTNVANEINDINNNLKIYNVSERALNLSQDSNAIGGYYKEYAYSELDIPSNAYNVNIDVRNSKGCPAIWCLHNSKVRISSNTASNYFSASYSIK